MAQDLLFEIGTEEIPARFMGTSLKQLKKLAEEALQEARLDYQVLATYGTPRRLCLYVTKLAREQEDRIREVKGPAKKAAYDAEGNPTKAALGFAKGQGVAVEELKEKVVGNGEYVFAAVRDVGKPTKEILPGILASLVSNLSFPKPMRWANNEFRFVRPIHWLVALLGSALIPVDIAGMKSGRLTYGHRFLSQGAISLEEPGNYFELLEKAYVIVDQEKRKRMIREQLEVLAGEEGGLLDPDEELLEEVTQLLEYPTAFRGSFSADYLALPEEVVITPMKEHQRYFPMRNQEGKLLPMFLAVRNGDADSLEVVREGNEKVLVARLSDAHFFYREDRREALEAKVEGLKSIVFQEKLGTLWDKTLRVQKLAVMIGQQLNWPGSVVAQIQRTAYLAKADLVSNMVNEFPELQGIMGGYYALQAEGKAVADGIREHYQPRFAGDVIPNSQTGIAVGIADKIDTIIGCFLAGLIPTGSQDPYALRRQALGISRTVLEHRLPLSLENLTAASIKLYADRFPGKDHKKVLQAILAFYRQRLENILHDDRGFPHEVVSAVLEAGADYPFDVLKRVVALDDFMERESFEALNTAFTRAFNLTKNVEAGEVDSTYLREPAEEELWQKLQTVKRLVERHLAAGDYSGTLEVLATLREPIDEFFQQVMVMAEDENIQRNRLALLHNAVELARKVADFSKI